MVVFRKARLRQTRITTIFLISLCSLLWVPHSWPSNVNAAGSQENSALLSSIVGDIQSSEGLFLNLLFDYTVDITTQLPAERLNVGKRYLKQSHEENRWVQQGRRIYFKQQNKADGAVGPNEVTTTAAFNGQRMRYLQTSRFESKEGRVANIVTGEPPRILAAKTPQSIGTHKTVPISEDLRNKTEVRLDGEETIQAIRCVRIVAIFRRENDAGEKGEVRTTYWLAPDRRYLPVRTEMCDTRYNIRIPYVRIETSDWREIEPGIEIPFKSVKTNYWEKDLRLGKKTIAAITTITVTQVSLKPNFGDAFFEDLQFQPGTLVYVVENGNIVESYTEGSPLWERPSIRKRLVWILAVLCALLGIGVGAIFVRRRLRSRAIARNKVLASTS